MTFTRMRAIIAALAVPLALSAVAVGWAQSSPRPDEQRPAPRQMHPGTMGPDTTTGPMTGDMRQMMQTCTQMMNQMMGQEAPTAAPKGGER